MGGSRAGTWEGSGLAKWASLSGKAGREQGGRGWPWSGEQQAQAPGVSVAGRRRGAAARRPRSRVDWTGRRVVVDPRDKMVGLTGGANDDAPG